LYLEARMSTTMGLKLTDELRVRLKACAEQVGRTPHWLAKQALLSAMERLEQGAELGALFGAVEAEAVEVEFAAVVESAPRPFLAFAQAVQPQSVLRARITGAYRRPEPECLPYLIELARQPAADRERTRALALGLVEALRRRGRGGGAEGLLDEYSLSSQEGVALMCLAEALLRIPDAATRDALIRDKIAAGDWEAHLGHSPSMFVNAATWGLVITGKLTGTSSEAGLSHAATRAIGRGGEPVIRRAVAMAMRLMGEQFVTGQTIGEALANARKAESRGFRFSYDMLGEAATTAEDAERYYVDYERAIRAIGRAAGRRGIYEGPGISVKLSALHPRYSRAQADRVMGELLPRLKALAVLARSFDIGLNIDAEESDRLELSLDLLESLCFDPDLAGWNGVGFVVQAYGKRCPFVVDWLIDLAHRSKRRLMVRLVKGAYWDSEIKRAQVDGLEGFPVYTRKLHTDVSYLACARTLLAAPDAVFPQFATHNAQTLAAIYTMAGGNYYAGQYEFQCLHGMGEPLYDEVVGAGKLNRPCRIYAPVGTHETLLAYLVRRLLENGANTSFVNRVADPSVQLDDLVADPVESACALEPVGAPHPKIALPRALFGAERYNSAGIDLANEQRLASLSAAMLAGAEGLVLARPMLALAVDEGVGRAVLNPADHRDQVGTVVEASEEQVAGAVRYAASAALVWGGTPAGDRADCLARAADLLEARMPGLIGLIVREAGKTLAAAVSEVREAVDFLRYYGAQSRLLGAARPLGAVVCISPWNFPLAIFMGQVAAALAAGNSVLAKPAEQTPLIAARAVAILHEAGVPADAVQLLPGDGRIGAALVADPLVRGVVFTGSTEVARSIQRTLAERLTPSGQPIPLIAETGGQNALVVDSSALAEQVVGDVLASAFDSAGQRCSALRILCLQDDIAERTLGMLRGAMAELCIGNPDRLATDIGPVIDAAAAEGINAHVAGMRERGFAVSSLELPEAARHGTFVAPTLIEINRVGDVAREVFGPVLHVLRYRRGELERLIADINATGYGLTFGLHTRIDETIARVGELIAAGNIYVNRNIIGAVVGVQPFGGEGLSGTGPKAGGPLYLRRLVNDPSANTRLSQTGHADAVALRYRDWLRDGGYTALAARCDCYIAQSGLGDSAELPGPVGERNRYGLHALGQVACIAGTREGALLQVGAALATGNHALVLGIGAADIMDGMPREIAARVEQVADLRQADGVLFEGDSDHLLAINRLVAGLPGPVVRVQGLASAVLVAGSQDYRLELLLKERSVATNVAAAGGNASLMTIG
jgi:RHH-type proline utilization regulon transcriptional repressor/proline dehydrogenase/delta 1-pyrroline-5-carboxylate dehydrogenase